MATTIYPRINVSAPARSARTGGLVAVSKPIDSTDPHGMNGVQYEADACALPDFAPGLCDPAYIPADLVPDTKDYGNGPNWLESFPFALYVGFECYMPGADYEDKALAILEAGESFGLERALSVAKFQSAEPTVLSGTYDLKHGIALLEQYLGSHYQGAGLLHMSRNAASLALTDASVQADSSFVVSTKQGVPVANGAGYELNGPSDTAPATGKEWIYATGDVHIFRSVAETYAADNPTLNQTDALAERVYNITIDCDLIVAVQVTL